MVNFIVVYTVLKIRERKFNRMIKESKNNFNE